MGQSPQGLRRYAQWGTLQPQNILNLPTAPVKDLFLKNTIVLLGLRDSRTASVQWEVREELWLPPGLMVELRMQVGCHQVCTQVSSQCASPDGKSRSGLQAGSWLLYVQRI